MRHTNDDRVKLQEKYICYFNNNTKQLNTVMNLKKYGNFKLAETLHIKFADIDIGVV